MNNSSEFLQKLNFTTGEITACDMNANYLLAIGLSDNTVRVLEWKTGLGFVDMFYSPSNFNKYKITIVKFSPKGTMLVSASLDGTATLLDVQNGTTIFTIVQHNKSSIKFCQFVYDSTKIITAADDGIICFWDLLHQRQLRHFRLHEDNYNLKSLTLSPDSEYLISIDSGDLLKLWFIGNITNNEPLCILQKRDFHDDNYCCQFSPIKTIAGGPFLKFKYNIVTCGGDSLIRTWDVMIEKRPIPEGTSRFKCDIKLVNILKQHVLDIISVTYDPSGSFIVSTGLDNLIKLWEVRTGKSLKTFHEHTKLVTCSAFSKNSILLATGSIDKQLIIWDLSQKLTIDSQILIPCNVSSHFTQIDISNYFTDNIHTNHNQTVEFTLTKTLQFFSAVNCIQFHKKNNLIIAGGEKTVAFWENNTLMYKNELIAKENKYSFNCLDVSSCGSKVIFCSSDGAILFWDLNINLTHELKTPDCTSSLQICKFLPNSNQFAAAGDDQNVYLWDTNTLEFLKIIQKHENAVTALAFTPDSKYAVSACSGGHVILKNLDEKNHTSRIDNAHDLGVTSCDFFPIEISETCKAHFTSEEKSSRIYLLATGGRDSLVKLWRVERSEVFLVETFSGHGDTVNCVKFSPNETFVLASCSSDTTVRIWHLKTKQCVQVLNFHKCAVTTCSFSSDSNMLATGSSDQNVFIFKLTRQFYCDPVEHSRNSNKLLENWTKTDVADWFLRMGWKEIADKMATMELNGSQFLMTDDDTIVNYSGLESENDRKTLKFQVFCLKKQYLNFSTDVKFMKKTIPHMFLCPITHEIMKEPVICSDGFVYDREALTEWFLSRKFISPVTKEYLKSTKFLSYLALKINIYKFLYENEN